MQLNGLVSIMWTCLIRACTHSFICNSLCTPAVHKPTQGAIFPFKMLVKSLHTHSHLPACKCTPVHTHLQMYGGHTQMCRDLNSLYRPLNFLSVPFFFTNTYTLTHSNTYRLWNVGNTRRPVLFSFYSVHFPLGTSKENICVWNSPRFKE